MIIFRSRTNQKLYTIEKVSPRSHTGHWYEATPYGHSTPAFPRKHAVSLNDFIIVSEK